MTPRIVVLSAPSGGGKTTIAKAVRDRYPDRFGFSVSATTRKPRAAERDGVDYHFWDRDRFGKELQAGKFLEHAEYAGEQYGTLKDEVEKVRKSGRHVLLDIDVEGAKQVLELEPDAITIFLLPSDPRVLLDRLVKRKSETLEELKKRLDRADYELNQATLFNRWIRNDDLQRAVSDVVRAVDESGALQRQPKDFTWLINYGLGLTEHAQKLYDEQQQHQQKG